MDTAQECRPLLPPRNVILRRDRIRKLLICHITRGCTPANFTILNRKFYRSYLKPTPIVPYARVVPEGTVQPVKNITVCYLPLRSRATYPLGERQEDDHEQG